MLILCLGSHTTWHSSLGLTHKLGFGKQEIMQIQGWAFLPHPWCTSQDVTQPAQYCCLPGTMSPHLQAPHYWTFKKKGHIIRLAAAIIFTLTPPIAPHNYVFYGALYPALK